MRCGEPKSNRVRPKIDEKVKCSLCGVGDGTVIDERGYEERFAEGDSSGSKDLPMKSQQGVQSSEKPADAKTMRTPIGPSSMKEITIARAIYPSGVGASPALQVEGYRRRMASRIRKEESMKLEWITAFRRA